MRHIAPIDSILGIVGRRVVVGIAEDESKHVGAIDHSFKVIGLGVVRWIPRAVEASAVLLHTLEFDG